MDVNLNVDVYLFVDEYLFMVLDVTTIGAYLSMNMDVNLNVDVYLCIKYGCESIYGCVSIRDVKHVDESCCTYG